MTTWEAEKEELQEGDGCSGFYLVHSFSAACQMGCHATHSFQTALGLVPRDPIEKLPAHHRQSLHGYFHPYETIHRPNHRRPKSHS